MRKKVKEKSRIKAMSKHYRFLSTAIHCKHEKCWGNLRNISERAEWRFRADTWSLAGSIRAKIIIGRALATWPLTLCAAIQCHIKLTWIRQMRQTIIPITSHDWINKWHNITVTAIVNWQWSDYDQCNWLIRFVTTGYYHYTCTQHPHCC